MRRLMLDIMATWRDFYRNLFTAEPVDSQAQGDMLANLESTLSDAEADL